MFELNTASPDLDTERWRESDQPFTLLRNGERWSTSALDRR